MNVNEIKGENIFWGAEVWEDRMMKSLSEKNTSILV
jgi:hypothetical protein